jgi:hypothetical protein
MQTLAVVGKQPSEVATHGSSRRRTVILIVLPHKLFASEVSMDFDPRSIDDSRDRDVYGRELNQGSRGGLSNPRERERLDPRDVFTRDLELPRGHERERVWARDSDVTLRASEVRTLAIQPYAKHGPHDVSNGVLLRADLHRLFDQGYVTITPEYRLEVSPRLKEDYRNGRSYYPLHGASVSIPTAAGDAPSVDFLRWHNERVYRAT